MSRVKGSKKARPRQANAAGVSKDRRHGTRGWITWVPERKMRSTPHFINRGRPAP